LQNRNENLKILFLTDNFPPETNAPAMRTFDHAKIWVESGHSVQIVTCQPNFPKGEVFPGYKNLKISRETIDGIEILRVPTFIAKNSGFFLRTLDFISFMIAGIFAGLFLAKKPDVIIATSPQFFTAIAGYVLSQIRKCPWVFEVRDLWPDSIVAVGQIGKESRIFKLLKKIEIFLYRKANLVVPVTRSFASEISSNGIIAEKIAVIPNGIPLQKIRKINSSQRKKPGDTITIGYIGTMGLAHGLTSVLNTAKALKKQGQDQYKFLFVGDGSEKLKLKSIAAKNKLTNVIFEPSCSREQVDKYWNQIDIALIQVKSDPVFSTVIPSKIFDAMAYGLPIIACAPDGELTRVLIECKSKTNTIRPGDPNLLEAEIKKLEFAPKQTYDLENYTREKNADLMIRSVEKMLN